MKNVCVITGTRADYGLLYWTLKALKEEETINLQLCATGMHLSPEFGLTYQQIEKDGFSIDYKVETLMSGDTGSAIAKSIGLGVIGFADAFQQLSPDLILVLGDRYEILAAVIAAMSARIPVAHCHGGELTLGAIDDAIRHTITKMSHLHFVSTIEYKNRVLQLGEQEENIHVVGALGLENLSKNLISKTEFEARIGRSLQPLNFIITYHPETLSTKTTSEQLNPLFEALDQFPNALMIFTQPNSDHEGRALNSYIKEYVNKNSNRAVFYPTLGSKAYLTALSLCDLVIGNSSSGIIEAPSFNTPTINIGDRQKGRIKAASVIDTTTDTENIVRAIEKGLSWNSESISRKNLNPYEGDQPAKDIVSIVKQEQVLNKSFNDIIL